MGNAPEHFVDRLLAAIDQKGSPVCVGLDPVYDRLPAELQTKGAGDADRLAGIERFCQELLDVVAAVVPAVKLQSAYFEALGPPGVELYFRLVQCAREKGLLVIGDVKRGDIGSTAEAYARAHMAGEAAPDAVTVNAYFGEDGLRPFVESGARTGRGVFALVRTSNPSAAAVQDFAGADGVKFYQHVARQVAQIGSPKECVSRSGYSCLGAVVAATYPAEARRLREIMPQQLFLVPGYGAQGAAAVDCAAAFKGDGTGAIVNASRSVIYAHQSERYAGIAWQTAVEKAAKAFAEDIRKAVGR